MERSASVQGRNSGPGNKIIVTTLLESLAVQGEVAAHARARRALNLPSGEWANVKAWLPEDTIRNVLHSISADPALVRSVGHRLLAPDTSGFSLYRLGLATPEKAYRRVQSLLPRANIESFWTVEQIGSGSARLRFQDEPSEAASGDPENSTASRELEIPRTQQALCALHVGMLEAIPTLYGLLPATVKESSCRGQGADACRFEVSWRRGTMTGLLTGGGIALGVVAAFGAAVFVGSTPLIVIPTAVSAFISGVAAIALLVSGLAMGRMVDLHRQLDAVAGARRGHLGLLDQVDGALAGKLDALARADTKLDGVEFQHGPAHVRLESSDEAPLTSAIDLIVLINNAITAARPQLPKSTIIHFDHDDGLAPLICEAVQIEQVVVQLLSNAAVASHELSQSPEVFVTLREVVSGIELAVEDRGAGIEPSEIDEVFDPFFGERRAGVDEGFGLPICLRIVERHGGELRIQAENRRGTRVSVLLPREHERADE